MAVPKSFITFITEVAEQVSALIVQVKNISESKITI